MLTKQKNLSQLWYILKITYGLLGIAAGIDKYFNMLTEWEKYVSPVVIKMLPISLTHFMYLVGVLDIMVGVLILSKFTKQGAYLLVGWLLVIILNLLSMGKYYDIAVRDAVMAVGAYVLAQMSSMIPAVQGNNK